MKEYVTNYRLNLYDCQEHDSFEEYQTGLRQMFEMVRYGKDKEKLRKIMEENREDYSRIDSETKEMLEVVANVKIPDTYKVTEEGEERYDMCKAFEDMRLEGIELGISREVIMEKCMEKFELTGEKANEYVTEYYI